MAANVGTLLVEIGADVARLRRDLGKAHQEAQNAARRISRAFDTVGASLAGAFSVAGIMAAAKATFNAAVEAERLSKAYGTIEGSAAGARQQLAFLRAESDRLGMQYIKTAESAKTFFASGKGTALEGEMNRIFTAVSETGTALQLSQEDLNGVFRALGQMISKGKVQAEELRGQLGERLPGAFTLAAKAMGVTTGELDKMLEQGQVLAEDLLPKLADVMHDKFGKAAMEAAKGGAQEVNRMATEWESFKANVIDNGPMVAAIKTVTDALKGANRGLLEDQMRSKGIKPEGQWEPQYWESIKNARPVFDRAYTDNQIKAFKEYGTVATEEINRIERAKQEASRNDYTAQALERAIGKASAASKDYLKGTDAEKVKKIRDEAQEAIAAQIKARDLDVENAARYNQRIAAIERERNKQLAEVGKSKREELKKQEQELGRFLAKQETEQAERHMKAIEAQYDAENEEKLRLMKASRAIGGGEIDDQKAQLNYDYLRMLDLGYVNDAAAAHEWLKNRLEDLDIQKLKSSTRAADGMKAALKEYAKDAGNDGANMFDLWTKSIKSTEDALTQFATKGEISVSSLFETIRAEFYRTQLIRPAMAAITSGLESGALWDGAKGIFASIFHDGGTVGQTPAPMRLVPASTFENAPRYHSGLQSGERPAILQDGEDVISRAQKARMRGLGGGVSIPVTIINGASGTVQVQARQVQASNGGPGLEIIIDELMARKISTPGTMTSKALRSTYGVSRALTQR